MQLWTFDCKIFVFNAFEHHRCDVIKPAVDDRWNNSTVTRAQLLRQIVESSEVATEYNHQAYAVMEYFGYFAASAGCVLSGLDQSVQVSAAGLQRRRKRISGV